MEDDRKTASLVALYLEREGFKTVAAYDGQQALELARQNNPIFVVLDLMLPNMDGWEDLRVKLGGRAVGWLEAQVQQRLQRRIEAIRGVGATLGATGKF